jgi:protein CpxP
MKATIKSILAGAAIVTAVSMAPVAATAHMGGDGPPSAGNHENHFKKMAKELQLTQQQKQQVKEIFAKNRPQAEPLMKQMHAERRALRSLVQADTIDEAAIRAQSAKIAAVEADLAVQHAHVAKEIRAILTPEQIAKQNELQAQRDKRMEERTTQRGKRSKLDK